MKPFFLILVFFSIILQATAQSDKTYKITYLVSSHGKVAEEQDPQVLLVNDDWVKGSSVKKLVGEGVFPYEEFYINWKATPSEYIKTAYFSNEEIAKTVDTNFIGRYDYKITDETKKILGYTCYKAVTTVNSNSIELWFTKDLPYRASPVAMGQELGLVLEYVRNGNTAITASEVKKVKQFIAMPEAKSIDA